MSKKGDLVARYAVTAAGSAVVETVFPGTEHEMVTVYHADGSDLVLTHYCMEGNQPRMRAKAARRLPLRLRLRRRREHRPQAGPPHALGVLRARRARTRSAPCGPSIAEGKPVLVAKSRLLRKAR